MRKCKLGIVRLYYITFIFENNHYHIIDLFEFLGPTLPFVLKNAVKVFLFCAFF